MSGRLAGQVAWVTGAGSGIGEAAAIALGREGATVVLTGRREAELERVAASIAGAHVRPGDVTAPGAMRDIADWTLEHHDRIDILVNNAGANIAGRSWADLTGEAAEGVIATNLTSAFHCIAAVLPAMRAQGGGVLIHTASWAGRFPSPVSGAAYSAAKHGMIAMSHLLNAEECVHGIRSTALCPAEVATPILDKRPVPIPAAERARMLQPGDLADLIVHIATLPPHVCINEVVISPTWNRMFAAVAP